MHTKTENVIPVILVIDVQLALNLGIIGYRNHAKKLISLIDKRPDCNLQYIYHPTKLFDDSRHTKNFDDLLKCDAIFIASPNHTHFNYLEKLISKFNGFIFCEKPPVTSLNEINFLESLSDNHKKKIFFNFNYRFSELNLILQSELIRKGLGQIIQINIISSHGLSFKNEYTNSWRSDGSKNLHNIIETVSIHYLDLLNFHFGEILNSKYFPSKISNNGTSFDTSLLILKYNNNVTATILNSYATPLLDDIIIVGTNGFLRIHDNRLEIFSPRDTFNIDGHFIKPPLFFSKIFNLHSDYDNSLKLSLNNFLENVKSSKAFDLSHFFTSINSNKLILKLIYSHDHSLN